jgi:hypothetical protein
MSNGFFDRMKNFKIKRLLISKDFLAALDLTLILTLLFIFGLFSLEDVLITNIFQIAIGFLAIAFASYASLFVFAKEDFIIFLKKIKVYDNIVFNAEYNAYLNIIIILISLAYLNIYSHSFLFFIIFFIFIYTILATVSLLNLTFNFASKYGESQLEGKHY